jgi:hypothetical protein
MNCSDKFMYHVGGYMMMMTVSTDLQKADSYHVMLLLDKIITLTG